MHGTVIEFFSLVKSKYPDYFRDKLVIEAGSLQINGSCRGHFDNCIYTGVDIASGLGVDLVSEFQNLKLPAESFDCVVSSECLEHNPEWKATLQMMVYLLRPGGLIVVTAGGPGRGEHGTLRTADLFSSPLTCAHSEEWANYYRNIDKDMIREAIDCDATFSEYEIRIVGTDIQMYGKKKK